MADADSSGFFWASSALDESCVVDEESSWLFEESSVDDLLLLEVWEVVACCGVPLVVKMNRNRNNGNVANKCLLTQR